MAVRRPPPGRGRPPPGRGRPPAGRGRPPPEQFEEEEELDVPQGPPLWERAILSRTFKLVVGITCAFAAVAILMLLLGPAVVFGAIGSGVGFAGRTAARVGGMASVVIADSVGQEARRLWVETPAP